MVDWDSEDFVGGRVALDFANAVSGRENPEKFRRRITTPDDLYDWLIYAGELNRDEANWCFDADKVRGRGDRGLVISAHALQDHIYEVFRAIFEREEPDPRCVAAIYEALARAVVHVRTGKLDPCTCNYLFEVIIEEPEGVLYPMAASAARLLLGNDRACVKECGNCAWLFLDTSKNKRRRWCSMKTCGNRAKARRFYQAKKVAAEA
ncbi:MAG: CGNR zinc finger domain-containing protein [Sphingomonadales bacterium]